MNKEKSKGLTDKHHQDPDQVNRQVPLFGVRVQKVKHDGRYDEEKKAAHLQRKYQSVSKTTGESLNQTSHLCLRSGIYFSSKNKNHPFFCLFPESKNDINAAELTVLKYSTTCSECL